MNENEAPAAVPTTYTKQQFLTSETFAPHRDVLAAILRECEAYTAAEVKKLLNQFLRRKVGT